MVPEGTDVRFFLGRGEHTDQPDEIILDCDDSYQGLPAKVQCIVKWALNNDYNYALKLDDDTVLDPVAMLNSGYDKHSYVGMAGHRPVLPSRPFFVAGGFAYWMDKKSMMLVAEAELPSNNYDEGWVASVLYEHGIELHADQRYFIEVGRVIPNIERRRPAPRIRKSTAPGTFAWCIYLEPNGSTRYSTQTKIEEFKRVFAVEVVAKK